jgi:uncharacterized protein (TIGR02680 family)
MNNGMGNDRWIIHRIGLVNFWYYDEEEFRFEDGRLLLRGSNGSGKSVTMQSFIPLLLDGNKSPERLDPFGSRARKLENYLLGEEEGARDENTGYLFMEFHKPETGHFLTIGMGLRAKRGKPLDFWGFAITDGRRLGQDFFLYREVEEKIPLSKIELRNRISTGGEVHDSQGDYMAMVNRLLFGFENLEDYDELIKLLIQLRTPKLSKDFKPTVIYEIMNNSLQPLSDEDLRPMSEAIENMDNIKSQLEVLKESKKAADRLMVEYGKYNRYVLLEKTRDFVNSQERLDQVLKDADNLEKEQAENWKRHLQAEEEHERLKERQQALEHRRQQLEQHDSYKARQEIDLLDKLLADQEQNRVEKEKNLQGKKDKERQLRQEDRLAAEKQTVQVTVMDGLLEEMSGIAEDIFFYEHGFAEKELKEELSKEYGFKLLRGEVDRYRERIMKAKKALELEKQQALIHDRALAELETARREREDFRRELEKAENVLAETRDEFVERAYTWEKANTHLKLPADAMACILRAIHAYGQAGSYDDIIQAVRQQYSGVESSLNRDIAEAETGGKTLVRQKQGKEEELRDWKNRKEPEPARETKVQANRSWLEAEGIPFVPLYRAVDFRDGIPEEIRGRLEEALLDMGLLDALIVPAGYEEKCKKAGEGTGDRYVFPRPQFFRQDLSSLLEPVDTGVAGITYEHIDNVLKSILLNDDDECSFINDKGEYAIGLLRGRVSSQSVSRFLGVESRKRYRLENIQRLEKEILEINEQLRLVGKRIEELEADRRMLCSELQAFPGKEDLETAYNLVNAARVQMDVRAKETVKREELAEKAYKALKETRDKVRELTVKLEIPLHLDAYEQAEQDIGRYRDLLGNLETAHITLIQLNHRIKDLREQQADLCFDLDELQGDLKRLERNIREYGEKKRNYEELLKELHYEEIQREIETCLQGLKELPGQIEIAIRGAQAFRERHGTVCDKLKTVQIELDFQRKLNMCCREGFRKEYTLGYVVRYEEDADLVKLARRAYQELKGEEKVNRLREDYAASLQDKYHENRQYMAEYNLIMEHLFDGQAEEEDDRLNRVLASRKRLELSARIQGRDVNFLTLVQYIAESMEENEKLLRESDRQLFEDILANTVGKKIRARIYHSEQWVKKMNKLMEGMNTSSGLSFSLVWKNRAAETEEQLDTRELVDILKSDARLLTEEQMENLSAHFRSKIAQARKELEDKGTAQTFHAIMKDILDYRKWFEFQLFFTKTGESRKELTNMAFDRFSGGEKAMAMYVPLFSSVYARYDGARKDCPRIISLDEAFAGVDENNIRDMFRLIEELKLNFIINSQILWGDYDTVPSLSICELIRPNNADFVTVIRYRWNGKNRELLMDEDLWGGDPVDGDGMQEVAASAEL